MLNCEHLGSSLHYNCAAEFIIRSTGLQFKKPQREPKVYFCIDKDMETERQQGSSKCLPTANWQLVCGMWHVAAATKSQKCQIYERLKNGKKKRNNINRNRQKGKIYAALAMGWPYGTDSRLSCNAFYAKFQSLLLGEIHKPQKLFAEHNRKKHKRENKWEREREREL